MKKFEFKKLIEECVQEVLSEELVGTEKLADDLGQIVFRIETVMYSLSKHTDKTSVSDQCIKAIEDDIEKLKNIKGRILEISIKCRCAGTV